MESMDIKKIGLKETLNALRTELSESILASEGKEIRFEVGQIELEFQVAIEQSKEANGGVKFWVLETGGSLTNKDAIVHKIKIPFKPLWKDGRAIYTGSDNIPD